MCWNLFGAEFRMTWSNYFNLSMSGGLGLALQLGRWHTLAEASTAHFCAVCYYTARRHSSAKQQPLRKALVCVLCMWVWAVGYGVCKFIIKFVAWKLSCLFNGVVKCVFIMASLTALLGIHKSLWRRVSLQNLACVCTKHHTAHSINT